MRVGRFTERGLSSVSDHQSVRDKYPVLDKCPTWTLSSILTLIASWDFLQASLFHAKLL
jgi:hypothetical protein